MLRGLLSPAGVATLLDWLARITGRGAKRSAVVERILLLIAGIVFCGATFTAWNKLPAAPRNLGPGWAAFALILALLALSINALEFWISARLIGRRVSHADALRISVLGSAANVLPLPGAVLVRTRALSQAGSTGRHALAITTAIGILWIAAAALLACVLLVFSGQQAVLAGLILLLSFSSLCVAAALSRFAGGSRRVRMLVAVGAVELLSVIVSGIRLYAVARATGFDVRLAEAVTINLGAILSHAAGIVPGGLGLREAASGLFAASAGVAASVGVILSVLDRIVMYVGLGLALGALFAFAHRPAYPRETTERGVDLP